MIGLNVVILSIFKYLPLIGAVVHDSPLGIVARLVMPLGMSFWTFQALSYLFDLYREEEIDPSLLEFALYMALWPTVLSGPICRMPRMLPQLRAAWAPNLEGLAKGTHRIILGVLMIVLSQLLGAGLRPGQGVDYGFSLPAQSFSGLDVWILIVAYGFQLFFSFCGYSHLVIGAARLFGFELQENFNRPFLSTSISEFWTRWHMSLSFWIRDYLFFPLATVRAEMWWRNLSLVIAMFIFGLWHRGSVLFMIWGIYHGLLLVLNRRWQHVASRTGLRIHHYLETPLAWAVTFAGVSIGWIFFRAEDLHQAANMFRIAFSPARFMSISLPLSLCWLLLILGPGYFAILAATRVLDGWASAEAKSMASRTLLRQGLHVLARDRWVWVLPLSVVTSIYLFLLLRPSVTPAYPTLYGLY
jgi:alginate O-acetyltransferase complex protein AlgI